MLKWFRGNPGWGWKVWLWLVLLIVSVFAVKYLHQEKRLDYWLSMPVVSLVVVVVFALAYYFDWHRAAFRDKREKWRNWGVEGNVHFGLFLMPFAINLLFFGVVIALLGICECTDAAVAFLQGPWLQGVVVVTLAFFTYGDWMATKKNCGTADAAGQGNGSNICKDIETEYRRNFLYLDLPYLLAAAALFCADVLFLALGEPEHWSVFLGGATAFQVLSQTTAFVWEGEKGRGR